MLSLKQFVLSGFCIKCLGCCRFSEKNSVWSPQDIEPIPCGDNFICQNLGLQNNLCKIYSKRPFDCQLYPFLLHREQRGDKVYLAMDLKCPFIKENIDSQELKDYISYLEGFFAAGKELMGFIKQNTHYICHYTEDIKIISQLDEVIKSE